MEEQRPHRISPAKEYLGCGLLGAMSAWIAFSEGGRGVRLLVAGMLGALSCLLGVRLLSNTGPVFRDRLRWIMAMLIALGGPIAAGYFCGEYSMDVVTQGVLGVTGAAALLAVLWFSSSPQRGNGWIQRWLARPGSQPLCPVCGMSGSRGEGCKYCGEGVHGG